MKMYRSRINHVLVAGAVCLAWSLVASPQGASAFPGDMAIYREAGGGETVGTAAYTNPWDTTVRTTSGYTLGAGGDIALSDAGHYLVLYDLRLDDPGNNGNGRSEVQSWLRLDGSADLATGWSQGYMRRNNGDYELFTTGGGIIDVAAGQTLSLLSQRTDSAADTVHREPDTSGIQLLKLDDDWDYLRLSQASSLTGHATGTWADVTYDTQTEVDSGFAHTANSGEITLTDGGHYLVLANTYILDSAGGTTRSAYQQRVTLNDTPVAPTTTVYVRHDGDSCDEGSATIGTIIEATAGQTLSIEIQKETGDNGDVVGGKTALTVVKLSDAADYIRLTDTTAADFNGGTMPWDTELEKDAAFSHDTATNNTRVGVNGDGDYLFFTALYDDDDPDQRMKWGQGWEVNDSGAIEPYGQTGRYSRDQGNQANGNWSGIMLGLEAGDYVEVDTEQLGNSGTLQAVENGLQGVYLLSLFIRDMVWDGTTDNWMTSHWSGKTPYGNGTENYTVGGGQVTIASDPGQALSLEITGGEVVVGAGQTLTVIGTDGVTVGAGGALTLDPETSGGANDGGTLSTAGLVTAGTNTIGTGSALTVTGDLEVNSALAMTGATLTASGVNVAIGGGGALTLDAADTFSPADLVFGQGSTAGTLNLSGAAVTAAGDVSVASGGTGTLSLTDGELDFATAAPPTREVTTMTFDGDALLRLRMDPTPGDGTTAQVHTPLNVTGTATVDSGSDSAPQVALGLAPASAADPDEPATWTGGGGTWDADVSKWDIGMLPADGMDHIAVGDTFSIITAGTLAGNPGNVVAADANWQAQVTGNTIELKRINQPVGFGAPMKAVIDGASDAGPVARTTDLLVAGVLSAALGAPDAARLEVIGNATLNLDDPADLDEPDLIIDGDTGNERDDQDVLVGTGSTLDIQGNLIFGGAAGADGGTFRMTGGTVNVAGDILQGLADGTVDTSVQAAQFLVDAGTLTVDGDINVRSFRVADNDGTTGSYTLPSGKTLTSTGWLQLGDGDGADGTLTNDGGTIETNTMKIADEAGGRASYIQNSGSAEVGGLNIGGGGGTAGDGTGNLFTLTDGTFTTTGGFDNAATAAAGPGTVGAVTIGDPGDDSKQPVLTVSGGNFECALNGVGTVEMYGGTLYLDSNNFIPNQNASADGTVTFDGGVVDLRGSGSGRTNADLNFNNGTGWLTVNSGATVYVARDVQMSNDAAAAATLTIAGGEMYVRQNLNTRDTGTDTINLTDGRLVFGNDLGHFGGGSVSSALEFKAGTATFNWTGGTLAGLETITGVGTLADTGAGDAGIFHQQGGRFIVAAGTTTIDDDYQIDAHSAIHALLPVGTEIGGAAPGAAIVIDNTGDPLATATFPTTTGTYDLDVEIVHSGNADGTENPATFDGDTDATWEAAANWSDDRLPSAARAQVPANTQWTVVDSKNDLAGNPVTNANVTTGYTASTAGNDALKDDLLVENNAALYVGAVKAIIDDDAVTRSTDLHIHDGLVTSLTTPADAAALEVRSGASLTLSGASDLVLGGPGQGVVVQAGDVSIGGDLVFGVEGFNNCEGGEYTVDGGTLTVSGEIRQAHPNVNNAQLYIDGSTLAVTGDILVQSFRTGNAPESNGAYTLPAGKTLTATGTLYAGNQGTGALTNDGGTIEVSNRFDVASSDWVDDNDTPTDPDDDFTVGSVGTYVQNAGTLNLLDGGLFMAKGTGSTATVQIGKSDGSTDPYVLVGDDSIEVAVNGTGTYTQYGGTFMQSGASGGNDNLVVTQNAGSVGEFNLLGGEFDLRGLSGQATDGQMNFNRGVGTATISGPTARMYVSNKVQMGQQADAQGTLTVNDGAEMHVRDSIDYRTGGMIDTVNLKGGLLNFYGDGGGTISKTDVDDQFNWTGGRLQNLTTFNGNGGIQYVSSNTDNNYPGSLLPASPTLVAGKVGTGALDFNNPTGAENNHVTFGDADLGDGQGKFSISLWFNRESDRDDATNHDIDNVLVAQSSGPDNDNFELGTDGSSIEFYLDSGTNIGMGASSADAGIANDAWTHVVFTYDDEIGDETANNVVVYVNGSSNAYPFSGYDGTIASSQGSPFTLGIARPNHDAWGDFDGKIDEVAVWEGAALATTDVDDLYASGSGSNTAVILDSATFYATLDALYTAQALEQDAGVMAPGASIGTATINDNYDVGDGTPSAPTTSSDPEAAVWEMELDPATIVDGAVPDANGRTAHVADFIDVEGALSLDTDSVLQLIDVTGSAWTGLDIDSVFIIAEYNELVGQFGSIEIVDGPADLDIDYNYLDNNQIAITPEPASLALLGIGAAAMVLARRRRHG